MFITELILIVSLMCFALGIAAWFYNWKNRVNFLFGLSTCIIGLWVFLNYIFHKTNSDFVLRLIYALAPFILYSIVLWVTSLKYKKFKKDFVIFSLIILSVNVFFAVLSLFSSKIVEGVVDYYNYQTGAFFYYYTFYNLLLFTFYVYYFVLEYRGADKIFKDQIKFILIGVVFTVVTAAAVGFILPAVGITKYNIFDSPSSVFFVIFGVYSIMKYKFLNIKVIATEVFAAVLFILSLRDLLKATDQSGFITQLFISVIILIFGALLIRSVIIEVRRREEMERLKKELEIAYGKLKEADQAKTDFLSMASHQLRSPLTVVRLGIGALLDGTFGDLKDKRQIDALNKMLESSTRLINLIGEYLNVSRIELGKMKYNFKAQNLCALVKEIVEEYQPRAKAKKLKLTFTKKGAVPNIKFDEEKIRHVIVNLIDNAIKYTMKGGIEVRCEVVYNPPEPPLNLRGGESGWVKVSFKDTGLGLDREDIAVLFQKFRRASSSTRRRREGEPVEGSGLGLHVAKMFVEKHGGKIWAESEGLEKGSCFIFTLPLSGPPQLPADELGEGGKGVEMPRP